MANPMFTGVSGLRAHQQMLEVVGNNLANSNTPGFKSQRVRFADLVYQTLSPASSSSAEQSGTNPLQVGLGVRAVSIDANLSQGGFESTGNDLDLALQGNGFFVVNNGMQNLFTRAGAFGVDSLNYLVDPATGFRVQRFGSLGEASPTSPAFQATGDIGIKIPYGTAIPGRATEIITLQGNLSANALGPQAHTLTSGQPFLAGGSPATATTLLNSLDGNTVDYVGGDTIVIQGTRADGSVVNTTFPAGPATTLGDLVTAINAAFPGSTATLDAAGNLVLQASVNGPNSLNLTLSDSGGNTGQTGWGAHGMAVTTLGKDGDTINSAIQFYDSQGTPHTLNLVFRKDAVNTWSLTGSVAAADGTLTDALVEGITFNPDGSFRQVNGVGVGDAFMTIAIPGIAAPQRLSFAFGAPNGFNGLTQFGGNSSAAATQQDGYAAGFLSSVSVSKEGVVNGIFTNGQTLPVAQLALATFQNPGALNREGDNYYSMSSQSGVALIGAGGAGGRGMVQQKVLESSNVDVALEFTRLIIAQRGFQVNARAITVSDQVLQEVANIIR